MIAEGETLTVTLTLDTEPRTVTAPADLAAALDGHPEARAGFDRLPCGLKRRHRAQLEGAKAPETRARRIAKLVASLEPGSA